MIFSGAACMDAPPPGDPVQAAARLWPQLLATPAAESRKDELVEKMRAVRPVLETGWGQGGRTGAWRQGGQGGGRGIGGAGGRGTGWRQCAPCYRLGHGVIAHSVISAWPV